MPFNSKLPLSIASSIEDAFHALSAPQTSLALLSDSQYFINTAAVQEQLRSAMTEIPRAFSCPSALVLPGVSVSGRGECTALIRHP